MRLLSEVSRLCSSVAYVMAPLHQGSQAPLECFGFSSALWAPNVQTHLPPKAAARYERRLEAVRCSAVLGPYAAAQPYNGKGLQRVTGLPPSNTDAVPEEKLHS